LQAFVVNLKFALTTIGTSDFVGPNIHRGILCPTATLLHAATYGLASSPHAL